MTKEELLEKLFGVHYFTKYRWGQMEQQEFALTPLEEAINEIAGRKIYEIGQPDIELPDHPDPDDPGTSLPGFPGEWGEPIEVDADFDSSSVSWQVPDGQFFPMVGRRFSLPEFRAYVRWVKQNERYNWTPTGITAHHTAFPYLSMRPNGFTEQHMANTRYGYINDNRPSWSKGPHLFVDDKGVWVFNPLSKKGIHAKSFNNNRYGVEMLGDYDYKDDPHTGRGKQVTTMGKIAIAILMKDGGISKDRLNFHKHDTETNKTCPGTKIDFDDFEADVQEICDTLLP